MYNDIENVHEKTFNEKKQDIKGHDYSYINKHLNIFERTGIK